MAPNRIDRKELEHDPYRDIVFELIDYVYARRRWFILGAIALLAIAGAAGGGYVYFQRAERIEAEALMAAMRTLDDPSQTQEARMNGAAQAFRAFVETHPRSGLTPIAWLVLARIAWEQKQFEPAAQAFQHVLDERKSSPLLRAEALVGLGKLKEAQGKPAEAISLYQQMGDSFQDLKQLSLGRAALASGNVKEAREHFLQAAGAQGYTGVTIQAREALEFLP
jgi:predicted negative regulator of RcsB-dependent stress response